MTDTSDVFGPVEVRVLLGPDGGLIRQELPIGTAFEVPPGWEWIPGVGGERAWVDNEAAAARQAAELQASWAAQQNEIEEQRDLIRSRVAEKLGITLPELGVLLGSDTLIPQGLQQVAALQEVTPVIVPLPPAVEPVAVPVVEASPSDTELAPGEGQ